MLSGELRRIEAYLGVGLAPIRTGVLCQPLTANQPFPPWRNARLLEDALIDSAEIIEDENDKSPQSVSSRQHRLLPQQLYIILEDMFCLLEADIHNGRFLFLKFILTLNRWSSR